MKRILLILGATLICFVLRAQSEGYTCRYWFDKNYAQALTTTFNTSTWEAQLDVGDLSDGVHTLHLQLMAENTVSVFGIENDSLFLAVDTSLMQWSAPQSYLFLKTGNVPSSELAYQYWFDQDYSGMESGSIGNGHLLLDVDELNFGLHSLHLLLKGSNYTATQSYLFLKTDVASNDGNSMIYHCWFDQDFEHQQANSIGDGHILLDANSLEDGLHIVNVMLEGSQLTTTQSYMFMKMAVEDPNSELHYICWFDQDYENVQTGLLGSGIFELEASDLPNGIHTVNIQLDNGSLTAPLCYMFYKQPLGGYGVARWEYWVNDEFENRNSTIFPASLDTLEIITLLPVGHPELRSSCFQFHPNGDAPYINAKNQITFRVWDSENRFFDQSAFFVDEQVQQNIVAQVFERNTTETFAAPRNNQIQWFKLDAAVGDSLAFVADKACTMQLFAPSGEEVYNVSGLESITLGGLHAWEDGTYYLAVHDQTGSGETVSVTYNWVYRYAVLAYDVHLVGNGGRSTIAFQGNGFNSLLDVYLVNEQNDPIQPLEIGHESNTTTTVSFDFYGVNLGMYDAVFQFVDDVIQIQNAIQVEEATPFEFDASVTFAAQFLRTTSNKYVFKVRNMSNMTAYNVPLLVHIYTPDAESLIRVDIDGFDVKSDIIQLFGSHYTDSIDNIIEQKRLTSGDLFGFLEEPNTEYVPEAPYLHYIFITPTLRPNTTETFTIAVKSTNTVTVYMWYPEEWENEDSTGNSSRTKGTICSLAEERRERCAANQKAAEWDEIIPYPGERCDNLPKPNPNCPPPPGGHSTPVNSLDPNDIHGYLSESGSHYMRQEIQNIHYEIEFENDTTLASAAAHTIIVRDTLDATKFDLSSLAAHSVTIGDKRLELNGEQNFARTLDMRPELYVIAQINQEYDPNTGIVVWTIQSLDPMTMEPTDNPHQGVLPVNYFGDGVGFIDYSVNLKAPFEDGTQVSNRAGIVFDQEGVIMTPTWTNTVDAVPPTSQMVEVTPVADSLVFVFNSEDNRSGMWYHTLYYRNDFTEMEWETRKTMILENRFALKLEDLQTTEYYVVAVDSAGNVEPKEQLAEYVFSLEDHNYYNVTVVAPEGLGTTTGSGTYVENSDITIVAIPAEGYHFTQWNDGNTENPRAIHVTQDLAFTAQFAINRYLVEVVSDDNNMGSVTGGAEYNHGTQVTVVAEANQGFHFMYWLENDTIASLDAVFNFVVTCPRSLTAVFATGNGNQISHTESFSAGWNWFSSFVEYKANTLSLFENDLSAASTSASIKSQRDGFATLENNTWAGTLSSLFNEQMYLVSVTQDVEIAILGVRVNPQNHPVTLEPGWNWIGYMSPMTMSLDESLASITPSENDVIKGQTGFSTYIEENGWMGSLNAMRPGQGYIYLNNSTSEITLVYPQTSRGYIEETATPKHWNYNPHLFPTNLTMMVTLDENEFRLADGLYEIGAFVNGECRGSARIQYLESLGNYVAFLTVCGEEGEEVSFRLFDVASNKVLDVIANEQIVYHADAVHGSLKTPMTLHFRNTGVNDEHHEVSLFPNPTTGKVTVKAVGMNRLTVTDVLGQVVFDTDVEADQIELNLSNCESGLYMIHVNTDAFTVVRRFVLAK